MFDVDNQMGGMPFPEVLNISSPAYSLYCALFLNKDTFMGQPITLASDTGKEAAEKRAAYVWRQIAPALAAAITSSELQTLWRMLLAMRRLAIRALAAMVRR